MDIPEQNKGAEPCGRGENGATVPAHNGADGSYCSSQSDPIDLDLSLRGALGMSYMWLIAAQNVILSQLLYKLKFLLGSNFLKSVFFFFGLTSRDFSGGDCSKVGH